MRIIPLVEAIDAHLKSKIVSLKFTGSYKFVSLSRMRTAKQQEGICMNVTVSCKRIASFVKSKVSLCDLLLSDLTPTKLLCYYYFFKMENVFPSFSFLVLHLHTV